jgi:hypothetical protein
MIDKIIKENTFVRTYNSLHEFLAHTDRTVIPEELRYYNKDTLDTISDNEHSSWRYGSDENLTNFIKTRTNPNRARDLCKNAISQKTNSKEYKDLLRMSLTHRKKPKITDIGGRISVSHAVSGEEKYFIQTKAASRPTVKIGINLCVSAMVDADDLIKIAQQAIPTVYLLEAAGIATEICMCTFSTGLYDREDDDQYNTVFEVPIKTAQQRFNWSTFSPVFSSGTYRYNFFRSWCMVQDKRVTSGLGSPMADSIVGLLAQKLGYTAIIGVNNAGMFDKIREIFGKK